MDQNSPIIAKNVTFLPRANGPWKTEAFKMDPNSPITAKNVTLWAPLNSFYSFWKTAATLIDGRENSTVGGDFNFRFRMLLKGAVSNAHGPLCIWIFCIFARQITHNVLEKFFMVVWCLWHLNVLLVECTTGAQSRSQSPQAFLSVVGRPERLWDNGMKVRYDFWRKTIGRYTKQPITKKIFPQSLSRRPTADKKAWGLWDRDWQKHFVYE